MSSHDQLEVITPSGVIEFFDLRPGKGITNVGSHPENDVVLEGTGIAPFHLMVDHRQRPYQLMLLSDEFPTQLGGQRLQGNHIQTLQNWDTIEVGGNTLILLQGRNGSQTEHTASTPVEMGTPGPMPSVHSSFQQPQPSGYRAPVAESSPTLVAPPSITTAQFPPALTDQEDGVSASHTYVPISTPVRDHIDDYILVEMLLREQLVDVGQTVAYTLTITNGGDLVSNFQVDIEGIDPSWVVILPAQLNLNDTESGMVTITMTPPRHPSSLAGRHHFAIKVTTAEYPDRYSEIGGTLVVNPYHEVQVGELAQKRQTLTWNNPVGETYFAIANGGNSITQVQVEAQDDERSCHFEFQLPNHAVTYARQTELRLAPGEATEVTLLVESNERPLIGFRNRIHQYDVRVLPLAGQQFPRTVGGQVKIVPLIGKWMILLFLLLMTVLLIAIFTPRIDRFEALPAAVAFGEPIQVSWRASIFSNVNVSGPGLLNVENNPSGVVTVVPPEAGVLEYQISVDNFISRIGLAFIGDQSRKREVVVGEVRPGIRLSVNPPTVVLGQPVLIEWNVSDATEAILTIDGVQEKLTGDALRGSRSVRPERNMQVSLSARNPSIAPDAEDPPKQAAVTVLVPTSTPVPTPAIFVFDANPVVVTAGEPVELQWQVGNVETVAISNVGEQLPSEGSRQVTPAQTTTYQLSATNPGSPPIFREITVFVNPAPTATPLPQAPVIEYFKINTNSIVLGNPSPVTLSWAIKGDLTDVQIFSPDFQVTSSLTRTGTIPISPEKSTFFILTASNKDQSSTAQVEITVATPTPVPTLPPPPAVPVFSLSSSEITAGDTVILRWQVENTDQLVITENGVPINGVAPSGELRRQPMQDTRYELVAGEKNPAIRTAQVYVKAAPQPQVSFFTASSGAEPAAVDEVTIQSGDTYLVLVGAQVKLSWATTNASSVKLSAVDTNGAVVDYGDRPISGDFTFRYDGSIRQFNLVALRPGPTGNLSSSIRTLNINPREIALPAPFGLTGTTENNQNKLNWQYDSLLIERIRFFRVYRASATDMNFQRVAELERTMTTWTDTTQPSCNLVYFVVAVYTDINGNLLETNPSGTSWYSPMCS